MPIALNRWPNTAQDRHFRNNTNENWDRLERKHNEIEEKSEQAAIESSSAQRQAEEANKLSASVQEQINSMVVNGDSSVEAAQARVDTEGITHDTLKSRLDGEFQKNATQIQILNNLQISIEQFPIIFPEITDRPRFQRAFNYAKNNGIGTVKIPKNDYVFDGIPVILPANIIIDSNGASILIREGAYANGIGFFTTRVDKDGVPKLTVDYDPNVPVKEDITFRGKLILDGNMRNVSTTNPTSTCSGIVAYRVRNFRAEGLIIQNLPGFVGGGYGIIAAYSDTVYLNEIIVDRTDRQNICIWETLNAHVDKANLNYSQLRECILVSTNTPVSLQTSHCTISNSKMRNASAESVHVVRFSGFGSGIIENTEIEGTTAIDGVYVTDTCYKFVRILNNKIRNCMYGIRVESSTDKYIIAENNDIESCINGIRHNASGGTAVYTKNRVKGSTNQPFYIAYADYQTVTDNEFDGGTQVFIRPNVKSHFISNKVRNMSDLTYAVVVGGDTIASISFMMNSVKNNISDLTRILTAGRAVGNDGFIETASCYTDQTLTSIASKPFGLGQLAVVAGIPYISVGTSSPSDWKKLL
ncbi:right-handed parallel beta-helix repeat-containing protein [Bacillus dicomae]|uniref:Uncharacterized protein n=1 Tax=Bacillus dicomae TaxID=3088378 RepID=A0AC61SXR8_9BACI|nr:hypothetical protein [Bacillus dicomae]TPV37903.1 hypothetical protein FJ659_27915 [Bacillus dicomae]